MESTTDTLSTTTTDEYTVPRENWYGGIRYSFLTPPDVMSRIKDFPVHEEDVFVCGYPKTGTVWMTTVVSAILQQDDLDCWLKTPPIKFGRELEMQFEVAQSLPRPTFFYAHLPYHLLPAGVRDKNVKTIHISRDPKDAAVSYFYFHKNIKSFGPWNGPWDVFFDNFISGQVVYGSYFDFVRTYWAQKNNPNIMNIRYENLKKDPKTWIGKLSEFLGKPLEPEKLDKVVELTSFDNMKKTPALNMDTFLNNFPNVSEPMLVPGTSFLRKGQIGDWRHLFTEEQRHQTDGLYYQLCKDTGMDSLGK